MVTNSNTHSSEVMDQKSKRALGSESYGVAVSLGASSLPLLDVPDVLDRVGRAGLLNSSSGQVAVP